MTSQDSWQALEYAPPFEVQKKGLPVLTAEQVATLRLMVPGIPSQQLPLSGFEAAMALCFEAPRYAFRQTSEGPKVERNALLAISDGELDATVKALDARFAQLLSYRGPLQVRERSPSEALLTIILDDPRFTEWQPLARTEDGCLTLQWGGFILEPPGN